MRQRGVALIMAILMVALATVVAVHVTTRAALNVRRTLGLRDFDQGWHVALGAEAWAIEVLREDSQGNDETDHPGERWAQPLPPLPVDGGEVRGALEDLQGRFNLNSLIDGDCRRIDSQVARFERLLANIGAEGRWAGITADWLDCDTVPGFPDGAEDSVYLAQNPPYRAANGPITTTTELLALPGMTLEEYQKIRPYVATLPVSVNKINLCTASAPLLAAIADGAGDFGDAESLAINRRDSCFPRREYLENVIGQDAFNAIQSTVSEKSDWFRATTAVRIGTSELTLYSLIERDSTGAGRTVLRSTGTE